MRLFLICLIGLVMVPTARAADPTLLVVGDSLSAAWGLRAGDGWVDLLGERLGAEKFRYRVVNASISGDTSAGGAARIRSLLGRHRPQLVIVALGANDGLRGLPVSQLRANLAEILRQVKRRGARILLAGMRLPPNYGPAYTQAFSGVYADLARRHRVAYLPFLLAGFADRPDHFQADGLHPTAAAQPLILDNVWAALRPLLR